MSVLTNPKHEKFAQGLAAGLSQNDAYVKAGFAANVGNAGRLNRNEQIQARVAEIVGKAAAKADVTVERIVAELARLGFSDVRKLLKWGGAPSLDEAKAEESGEVQIGLTNFVQLFESGELDDDAAACISEISQTKDGLIKVKLADKLGALVALGRHLKMFTDKVEHSGRVQHVHETPDEARANIGRFIERERQRLAAETAH